MFQCLQLQEINLCKPLQIHYINFMIGGKDNGIHQTGNKFDMQTGAIKTIRKSIQSLQDYLGSGECPNAVHSGAHRKLQDHKALEWATQNKKQIIPEQEFLKKWHRDGKIHGGENRVCFEKDSDGFIWAIKMNELTYHQDNMAAFADRLIKSSEYFPDTTLEIIGMVTTPRGVKPLLRQAFVVTRPKVLAYPAQICTALEEREFRLLDPDNEIWLSPDRAYYFSDPWQNNVLVDENGELAFIQDF